jgi:hypothetical protein
MESASWLPPSQVFADTQRVDLFNDPKWETSHYPSRGARQSDGRSWWAGLKAVLHPKGATPKKRGQHLKTPA